MPQMMPINWILSFISFILIFMLFIILNYYMNNLKFHNFNYNQNYPNKTFNNNLIWKW